MSRFLVRLLLCSALLSAATCSAWDTIPHQQITRAALDALPKHLSGCFGPETEVLARVYCMLPDRYLEMERYGFIRNNPGPRTTGEIRTYCVRPDGVAIHGASFDRESDTASIVYLFERILTTFAADDTPAAAKYAGVLSHFIGDTLSPPHADADACDARVHAVIERSLPSFTLAEPRRRAAGEPLVTAVTAVIERCYAGAAQNRRDLPAMIEIAREPNGRSLDPYRLRSGKEAAAILADALSALCEIKPRP
jgi:hypothetical protein